jgi:hypothetical protein|nr:MOL98_54 [Synthetic plasmid pMOL98]
MASNIIEQMLEDLDERRQRGAIGQLPETSEIQRSLSADSVLEHLAATHGLIAEKYETIRSDGLGWQIQCGSRLLDVVQFMSDEMHMKATEYMPILRHLYGRQQRRNVLYHMNKVSVETGRIAKVAETANRDSKLTDNLFEDVLKQLQLLNQQLQENLKTAWADN